MLFHETKLKGVFIIEAEPFIDDRGAFRRHFCKKEFSQNGIVSGVEQANVSENIHAWTLRGFHYQLGSDAEGKTLSCLRGAIYDIIVDLRPNSDTYMQWVSVELNENNRKSIHIAPGCANAFLTLEAHSVIQYYVSAAYNPNAERGIRYNDPAFEFTWPREPEFISEKDANHPDYLGQPVA